MDRHAMQRAVLGVDERFFAAAPASRAKRPWSDEEIALLREHYPRGGAAAALAALPGRERKAIQNKAAELGVRAPYNPLRPTATPTKYESSPTIDAEVRRAYAARPTSGELNALARRLMRPRAWIVKRAEKLGLQSPRYKPAAWTPAELELLESHAHHTFHWVRTVLAQHGYRRTPSAIACRVHRLGLDRTDFERYTTGQLGALMGVTAVTVFRWIMKEGLPAERRDGKDGAPFLVQRENLRRWIATHAQCVDLRKVERYWFIDLLTSPPAKPTLGRPGKVTA